MAGWRGPKKRATATAGGLLWCSIPHSTTMTDGFKPIELKPACRIAGLSPSRASRRPSDEAPYRQKKSYFFFFFADFLAAFLEVFLAATTFLAFLAFLLFFLLAFAIVILLLPPNNGRSGALRSSSREESSARRIQCRPRPARSPIEKLNRVYDRN